ncbi:putative mitochondrial 2-oxodicarboxylate carrier [Zancudomyces culisetae]|uniref:Putative mitochondrial 2-oxodicarboxylate carrier n=1 Tax=Zancudomyces culisetae TaxID=1213189 RepID=A0A1R1PW05_ZANCU|nr:putative mitochondrial 2-oxodicarboxylate carrier [Zancudomyces culisetae]|eukprot:OMH85155.1 putative mitochondrial 2-oxodicarboxylate carrier [Zancudomyces culisetae]
MYPLDVVKTRFQLQVGTGPGQYTSIADAFKRIIKEEGFSRLYRGILPPMLVEAPKRAIKFAANDQYGKFFLKKFGMEKVTQPIAVLTGVCAGLTEAAIVCVPELLKIRLQSKEYGSKYNGTMDVVRKITQEEGAMALFNGLESTLWRHGLWSGAYFGCIYLIKDMLPKPTDKKSELLLNFVAGTIGGTIGTTINTPADVVKTRMQAYVPAMGPKPYNSYFGGCAHIFKTEGFAALYKGYVPKVLRLGPGGGILLVVYDKITAFMISRLQ